VKYLSDKQLAADVTILYLLSKPEELAYRQEFEAARQLGVRLIPVLTGNERQPGMVTSKLDSRLIAWAMPDYLERLFYVSGPDAMVSAAKKTLQAMHISRKRIKTDYFSGY